MNIEIINERCPAIKDICQPLIKCPLQVITYFEDFNEPMGGRIQIDNERCNYCGICIKLCCGDAIIFKK